MESTSKDLLHLERNKLSPSSSLESALLVCNSLSQTEISQTSQRPVTKSIPTSQVLGKVKDFLGVMAEANKRLQNDSQNSQKDYNIEVLSGNETDYIEMDLMLGVTDLNTPEAVAAAESAMAGSNPSIPLVGGDTGSDSEDSSDDDDDDDGDGIGTKDSFSKRKQKKRAKIIELH